jgi:hypothetical protein
MGDFYVYVLAYPNSTVFYVGKGKGDRIDDHERDACNRVESEKCDIIRNIWAQGEQIMKAKVLENLTEEAAFAFEAYLIHARPRPKKTLVNKIVPVLHKHDAFVTGELATIHAKVAAALAKSIRKVSFFAISEQAKQVLDAYGIMYTDTEVHFPRTVKITYNQSENHPDVFHRYIIGKQQLVCFPDRRELLVEQFGEDKVFEIPA